MYFIPRDDWKTLFFIKVFRCSEGFSNCSLAGLFQTGVLKEVHILCFLQENAYIKVLFCLLIIFFYLLLFFDYGFIQAFILRLFHIFLLKNVFLKNSKSLWKHVFSNRTFMLLQIGFMKWEQNRYNDKNNDHINVSWMASNLKQNCQKSQKN